MIQLSHKIDSEKGTLTLIADAEDQEELKELLEEKGYADAESEALEHLLGNSELNTVQAIDTGDLSDTTLLGILGEEQREHTGPYGAMHSGGDEKGARYMPILERWGYEPYQIRSFVDDLIGTGKAVFHNAW